MTGQQATGRLPHAPEQPGRQGTHQLAQGPWCGLRQQRLAQHRVGGDRLQERQAATGSQGRIGPVLEQEHPGPLLRVGRQQGGSGMVALQMQGVRRGVGDHLGAVHQ
ncbi:MAG: hypothetical protein ACK56F_05565, partial [bacterium]